MAEPIRVLQVFHGMDCGGAENMIMNLYRHMDRTMVQFDFLVHTNNKCFFDDEIEALGGRIFHAPYYKVINTLSYHKFLHSFFRDHPEIHIVHGHLGSCAHVFLNIAKKYGCYTIAHSHNTDPSNISLKNVLYKLFSFRTRKIADYFFACSIQAGIDRFGLKCTKSDSFYVLKNAIDAQQYRFNEQNRNIIRSEMGISDSFVIGHIGRFNYQKNHDFLIDVFFEIQKIKSNAVLLLVGDGDLRKKIEDKVSSFGIADQVVFTGVRSDIPKLLQAMDCFVFPSLFEGLGIVAIEAQASGLLTICSDSLPEESNVTDLFHRISLKESGTEWAKEIISLSDNNNSRTDRVKRIGECGYDIVVTSKFLESFYLKRDEKIMKQNI